MDHDTGAFAHGGQGLHRGEDGLQVRGVPGKAVKVERLQAGRDHMVRQQLRVILFEVSFVAPDEVYRQKVTGFYVFPELAFLKLHVLRLRIR